MVDGGCILWMVVVEVVECCLLLLSALALRRMGGRIWRETACMNAGKDLAGELMTRLSELTRGYVLAGKSHITRGRFLESLAAPSICCLHHENIVVP